MEFVHIQLPRSGPVCRNSIFSYKFTNNRRHSTWNTFLLLRSPMILIKYPSSYSTSHYCRIQYYWAAYRGQQPVFSRELWSCGFLCDRWTQERRLRVTLPLQLSPSLHSLFDRKDSRPDFANVIIVLFLVSNTVRISTSLVVLASSFFDNEPLQSDAVLRVYARISLWFLLNCLQQDEPAYKLGVGNWEPFTRVEIEGVDDPFGCLA